MELIITCPKHCEEATIEEVKQLFAKFDLNKPMVANTDIIGIITVSTDHDPFDIIQRMSNMVEDEPWSIQYSQRVIPIQRTTITSIKEIVKSVEEIKSVIKENQTYRITIERRHSDISRMMVTNKIAETLPNKVSLENPDHIILVEILGSKTGVSIIRQGDILSTAVKKRLLSEED